MVAGFQVLGRNFILFMTYLYWLESTHPDLMEEGSIYLAKGMIRFGVSEELLLEKDSWLQQFPKMYWNIKEA